MSGSTVAGPPLCKQVNLPKFLNLLQRRCGFRQRWYANLVPFPLEDALYRISVHLLIIPTQSGIQS
jgi:hypothetical protein